MDFHSGIFFNQSGRLRKPTPLRYPNYCIYKKFKKRGVDTSGKQCYFINMLDLKINHVIGVNGLVRIQASPMSEAFDLWEDIGNNVWTYAQIVETAEKVTNQELIDGMKDSFGRITEPSLHDMFKILES